MGPGGGGGSLFLEAGFGFAEAGFEILELGGLGGEGLLSGWYLATCSSDVLYYVNAAVD